MDTCPYSLKVIFDGLKILCGHRKQPNITKVKRAPMHIIIYQKESKYLSYVWFTRKLKENVNKRKYMERKFF